MSQETGRHIAHEHDWNSTDYVARWISQYEERLSHESREIYQEEFAAMTAFIPFFQDSKFHFVDLGAGWGPVTKYLLQYFRNASATLIDFSEPMLQQAEKNLSDFSERVNFVRADLSESGFLQPIAEPVDLAVSCTAIHDLEAPEIRSVYAELYSRLEPEGAFLNLDFMGHSDDRFALLRAKLLVEETSVREASAGQARLSFREALTLTQKKFERLGGLQIPGTLKNLEKLHQELPVLPKSGLDVHHHATGTLQDHLSWLHRAGFRTDVWRKWQRTLIVGLK